MTNETPQIQSLHQEYVRLTGLQIPWSMDKLLSWELWQAHHWTADDLARVVRYVKRCMAGGQRGFNIGTLSFRNLIQNTDRFEELLAEAQATARIKPVTPRQRILAATGRHEDQPDACRSAAEILRCDWEGLRKSL